MILRNLQQQVGKNKVDIASLAAGIKVKGFGDQVPELQPGESWLKGTGPYHLIICTEAGNVDLGEFPAKGPQGIQGPKGDEAELGTVSATTETIEAGLNAMATVEKDGTNLLFKFELPQGERGVKGDKGDKGDQGPQGIQGEQGPQGEPSPIATLKGTFTSATQLPNPSTVPSYYAYLVGSNGNYTIYAQVNGAWEDIGNFEAIQGPQGPKGDSYGTFTKTVTNGNELRTVLTNLTPSQSLVGAYATKGSNEEQLIVLAYDKNQMVYAFSSATDYPDVPTTVTWQAVTSSDSDGKFEISGGYADSVTLYIYDPAARPLYLDLSKEADYLLYQGAFPGSNWGAASITNINTVGLIKGAFASQAQTIEAGKSYLCFYAEGNTVDGADGDGLLHARSFSVGSDGSSITWNEDYAFTPGAKVLTPKGVVYEFLRMPTLSDRIYDIVNPSKGKIPLSISSNSTINVKGLENVEATLASTTTTWQAAVRFTDCKDSNFHVDLRQMGYQAGTAGSQCIFSFKDRRPIQPLNFNSYGLMVSPQTNGQNTNSIVNSVGTASNVPVCLLAGEPQVDLVNERWQATLYSRHESYATFDHKFVRRDFDINFLGSIPMLVPTYAEELSMPSMQTMMMARAMSIEPMLTEEEFNETIKDKKGIFTIKDNKVYDLLAGEYVD